MPFVTVRYWQYYDLGTWGPHILKLGDFANISISKALHFVHTAGLLNASAKGCTKDQKQMRCKVHCGP